VTGVVTNAETETDDNGSHCTPKATAANAPIMKKDDDVEVDIIVLFSYLFLYDMRFMYFYGMCCNNDAS